MKKFQKSIPTEDARPGRNDRLGQDLNPGTYGLTAPAALFGTVLYNTQHTKLPREHSTEQAQSYLDYQHGNLQHKPLVKRHDTPLGL